MPTRPYPDHRQRDTATRQLLAEAARCPASRRGDVLDQVVLVNRPVAEAVARRFQGRGIDEDDLRQVAYEGLVKAVRRFEVDRGKDLLTFAVPTIRGELQRHFRDYGWVVRPTRSVQEAQWSVAGAEDRLCQHLGRHPSRTEICEALGLSGDDYAAAMSAEGCFHPTSLDRPVGADREDSPPLGEFLREERCAHDAAEARVLLAPAVARLSRREQRVLFLRYFDGLTQREIGQEIGVTQTQVSRILTDVLSRLKDEIGAQSDGEPDLPLSA